jgi:hypothetical protein
MLPFEPTLLKTADLSKFVGPREKILLPMNLLITLIDIHRIPRESEGTVFRRRRRVFESFR